MPMASRDWGMLGQMAFGRCGQVLFSGCALVDLYGGLVSGLILASNQLQLGEFGHGRWRFYVDLHVCSSVLQFTHVEFRYVFILRPKNWDDLEHDPFCHAVRL